MNEKGERLRRGDCENLGDAMEGGAVVDPGLGETEELAHVVGRLVGKELDGDVAHRRLDDRPIPGEVGCAFRHERFGYGGRGQGDCIKIRER